MSTIMPTQTVLSANHIKWVWAGMVGGDVGSPIDVSAYTWRSVSQSDPNGAVVVVPEVSNDGGSTWRQVPFEDGSSNLTDTPKDFANRAEKFRPHVSVVAGPASPLDVTLFASVP